MGILFCFVFGFSLCLALFIYYLYISPLPALRMNSLAQSLCGGGQWKEHVCWLPSWWSPPGPCSPASVCGVCRVQPHLTVSASEGVVPRTSGLTWTPRSLSTLSLSFLCFQQAQAPHSPLLFVYVLPDSLFPTLSFFCLAHFWMEASWGQELLCLCHPPLQNEIAGGSELLGEGRSERATWYRRFTLLS